MIRIDGALGRQETGEAVNDLLQQDGRLKACAPGNQDIITNSTTAKKRLAGELSDEDLGLQAEDTLVIFRIPRPERKMLFERTM
jgi:hypothetical protein